MKRLSLLLHFFLLTTLTVNFFAAESTSHKTVPLQDITFEENYFTPEERLAVNKFCGEIDSPCKGADLSHRDTEFFCVKIYHNKDFIGFLCLEEQCSIIDNAVHISHFFIDRPYQNKGIGTKALKYVLEKIFPDVDTFTLFTTKNAQRLYERTGFTANPIYDGFMVYIRK